MIMLFATAGLGEMSDMESSILGAVAGFMVISGLAVLAVVVVREMNKFMKQRRK